MKHLLNRLGLTAPCIVLSVLALAALVAAELADVRMLIGVTVAAAWAAGACCDRCGTSLEQHDAAETEHGEAR